MSLVDSLKRVFTADERIVYRCDACGATFRTDPDIDEPTCSKCDSAEVRQINRV
ncbi:zinc ribbon domain-containing protein [Haloplanus rubicundus]|jgi:DNA-directed RNA polymerase subunit RPC12/RpoP|uniref:zinc ribbon domain-containing protein n=1 Tax=Haloplanus rubicundus TaxID=1547898 RepID=UPI001650DD52|nr:zinc ribbon domain-containing protein [Haloplanus rubicundus]